MEYELDSESRYCNKKTDASRLSLDFVQILDVSCGIN